ncbi:MAG TPA: glutamate synthase [Candidatus Faecicola pullistercoris]|nr:glutamate synthase [Candidatus Faecicola pullistercoris]
MEIKVTDYAEGLLNEAIRKADDTVRITHCLGQRFIGAGLSDKTVEIDGIPGNALGAYLNGAVITVHANAQDAVGDTMNAGEIIVHGNVGDAAGYSMRGGQIFVKGNAGYRAGIHMKAYGDKLPVMVIGGRCGSFLGEYQAGGLIIVLGRHTDGRNIVGNFPCTGMHGGKVFLRGDSAGIVFPGQVTAAPATPADVKEIKPYVAKYCALFGCNEAELLKDGFTVITPNSSNPYKQMYVEN